MSDNLAYQEKIIQYRRERDARMVANPRNWLALVGLFWLEEGDNSFGNNESNQIVLPSLPADHCGILHLQNGLVSLIEASHEITLNGEKTDSRPLLTDADQKPDLIEAGSVSMMIIKRGEHTLLRTWDHDAAAIKDFKGLKYFPVNEEFRIPAIFTPYAPSKIISIFDMIGGEHEGKILGKVDFSINGTACSLEVEDADDEGLVSFVDQTKTDCSYPGGRYITLEKPLTSQVILDFNKAANWPCAYTSFATCPLPPQENHLPVRIEAGEKRYHD